MKSHSPITKLSIIQSFWNLAQSMAVILPCSVQNFKNDWTIEKDVMDKQVFTPFGFKISFGRDILYLTATLDLIYD